MILLIGKKKLSTLLSSQAIIHYQHSNIENIAWLTAIKALFQY